MIILIALIILEKGVWFSDITKWISNTVLLNERVIHVVLNEKVILLITPCFFHFGLPLCML